MRIFFIIKENKPSIVAKWTVTQDYSTNSVFCNFLFIELEPALLEKYLEYLKIILNQNSTLSFYPIPKKIEFVTKLVSQK